MAEKSINGIRREIVKKAEEGGYKPKEATCHCVLFADENGCPNGFHYPEWETMVLDPLFWIALGKALGFEKAIDTEWLMRQFAHRYLDIKLTSGDEEKFWKELLK